MLKDFLKGMLFKDDKNSDEGLLSSFIQQVRTGEFTVSAESLNRRLKDKIVKKDGLIEKITVIPEMKRAVVILWIRKFSIPLEIKMFLRPGEIRFNNTQQTLELIVEEPVRYGGNRILSRLLAQILNLTGKLGVDPVEQVIKSRPEISNIEQGYRVDLSNTRFGKIWQYRFLGYSLDALIKVKKLTVEPQKFVVKLGFRSQSNPVSTGENDEDVVSKNN